MLRAWKYKMKRQGVNVIVSKREAEMRQIFEERQAAAHFKALADRQRAAKEASRG